MSGVRMIAWPDGLPFIEQPAIAVAVFGIITDVMEKICREKMSSS